MRGSFGRTFSDFFIPGGLILFAAIGFLRPQGLPSWLHQPIAAFPFVVLAFGLIFGWYLSHARMVFSLLALAIADRTLLLFPVMGSDPSPLSHTIFSITAFLLPLNLLTFSILKDNATSTFRSTISLIVVLVQPFLVLWLSKPEQQDFAAVFQLTYVSWISTSWTRIPQAALLMLFLAGLMHLVRFTIKRDSFDGGSAWAIPAVFLAFHGQQLGWQSTNFFATAGLILFVSLIQSSYQRTYRDDLTGIAGRLAYEEATAQAGKQFALAVLSIDQLKTYSNNHGKSVAEQILKLVAPKVQANCQGGRVFRIGGEELTLLFRNQSAVETLVALEQVRKAVETVSLYLRGRDRVWEDRRGMTSPGSKDRELPLSVSIGVAGKSEESSTLNLVIKSAYRALYDAKAAGGNVVKRGMVVEPIRRPHGPSGRIVATEEY